MLLTTFPADKGDSFLLSWGVDADTNHLLIDSGTGATYRFIKTKLESVKSLKAIIATHVDYDHIGGFTKFLNDSGLKLEELFDFYMNTPSLALVPSDNDKVRLEHGIELDKVLATKGIEPKGLYIGFAKNNILAIEGLEIKIISPNQQVIDGLLKKWTANDLYKKYLEENRSTDKVRKPSVKKLTYDETLACDETTHEWQTDLINASSIAFIASYNGCKILFLGDANPDLIYDELKRLGYTPENKLSVDLVKISHHGCQHNTNKKLLSVIDCKHFLISTNGQGPYFHPDRETIVRLAEYSRNGVDEDIHIYLNYDLDKTNFISPDEETKWNIHIEKKESCNFRACKCFQKK